MPEFPEQDFVEVLRKLIAIDKQWIPPLTGSSLYIRPLMFAMDPAIGVKASNNYRFIIITAPAGPYYERPVSLYAETKYVRAADGGVGEAKAAGNYAASMYPTKLANERGFDQILWLDAKEFKYVQEVGTMNIFFVIDGVVITPATTGSILKGITRKSIKQILREQGFKVEERLLSIDEVIESYKNGKLTEVFGTGTAALVANVSRISYKGFEMDLSADNWHVSTLAKNEINGLRDGTIVDTRNWIVPVTEEVLA
jgi:branched-chain amino acid aminotransferase